MGLLKDAEIGFRKFLVLFLGLFVHRSRPLDASANFHSAKFLFIRQDRIGDVLVSTPLISLLKKTYPSATLDILLSENNYSVLEHEPLIRKRWLYEKNIVSIWTLIFNLRRERYDIVIDLMDNPSATSTLLLALAGGKWNIGLKKDNAYVYDVTVPLLSRKDVHIVDRLAELLRPLGIDVSSHSLRIRYNLASASKEFAEQFWTSHQLVGKAVIGVNISSGNATRFWGIDRFRDFISLVTSKYPDAPVLVLYHPKDKYNAEKIAADSPRTWFSPTTNSFDQFASFIQRLSVLVTPDTSAVHLAAAFTIPSVVLYVQSNKDLRIWEPYHTPTESLIADVDDLTTIRASEVFSAFQRLTAKHLPTLKHSSEQEAARK